MFEVLLRDEVRKSNRLRLNVPVDLKKVKLFYMDDDGGSYFASPVHKDLKYATMLGWFISLISVRQLLLVLRINRVPEKKPAVGVGYKEHNYS